MRIKIIFLFILLPTFQSYILPQVYREFHPIAIYNQVDKNKPTSFHIGKLPLLLWFDKNHNPNPILNHCKHLGNNLEGGVVNNNCLICPFHKTSHNKTDNFGSIVVKDGLVWWKFKSYFKDPPSIPVISKVNDDSYDTINFKTDININFINFIINLLYVNSNIKINYLFKNKKLFIKANDCDNNNNKNKLRIYYKYPYSLIISNNFDFNIKSTFMCNVMPIGNNKTRIYITVKFKKGVGNYLINLVHSYIIRFYLNKFKINIEKLNKNSLSSNSNLNLNLNLNLKKNLDNHLRDVYYSYKDYMDLFDDTTINNFLINKNFY